MIIAFSAKARSGKTTAARAIAAANPKFDILSFAKPLKRMTMEQFDLTPEDMEDKEKVLILGGREVTIRQLLIEVGAMYRNIDPDFWVKKLWKDAELSMSSGKDIVIDDMRFRNESNFLTERGAKLVRIDRPGVKLIDDISEKDLDHYHFEYHLGNTGTMADFEQKTLLLYDSISLSASRLR